MSDDKLREEVPGLPRHWEPLVAHLYETDGEFAESWDFIVEKVKALKARWDRP